MTGQDFRRKRRRQKKAWKYAGDVPVYTKFIRMDWSLIPPRVESVTYSVDFVMRGIKKGIRPR